MALALSEKLLDRQPDFVPFRLNRAHALMLNSHWDAAEAMLEEVASLRLSDSDILLDYQLGLFRLAIGRGQQSKALELLESMETDRLMPETRRWMHDKVTSEDSRRP